MGLDTETNVKISNLEDCPDDVETVANWYFNEWDHKDPQATLENVIEKVSSTLNRTMFVAHFDGELAGASELKYQECPEYPNFHHWLDGVYVCSKYRGKGISTALIEFVRSKAFGLKIPALYLSCEAHLVKLYESHGFQIVCSEAAKFIMELNLTYSKDQKSQGMCTVEKFCV